MLIGLWLIKSKGAGSTAAGLIIANIGLYAALAGVLTIGVNDRFAIVLTTLFISSLVLIMLPIGFVRVLGVILAILTFIALTSILATLPDSSYIKTVLTTFWTSVIDVWDAIWPG
ncbi:MAG: hypothetical protein JWM07_461 [Candidatus Saccharibacteria bacterium]|nr:hypothetical protein [Candidatus Saccharibacteria bacterium]